MITWYLIFLCRMDDFSDSELRHRKQADGEDAETIIRHQRGMHEKLTEEMLNLTRSLKQSVRDSGRIVQEDNKVFIGAWDEKKKRGRTYCCLFCHSNDIV